MVLGRSARRVRPTDPHDIRRHWCGCRTVATDRRRFRLRPESVVAAAALNDQQKCPGLTPFAHLTRARGGRRCWRRELGGRVQQHTGSTTALMAPGFSLFAPLPWGGGAGGG